MRHTLWLRSATTETTVQLKGGMVVGMGSSKVATTEMIKAMVSSTPPTAATVAVGELPAASLKFLHKVSWRRSCTNGIVSHGQGLAGAGEVVLIGCDGAKRVLVAGALRGNRLSAHDGFDYLSAGIMAGDHAGNASVISS